jgi:multiple sugar transport system substrate-binding protein
MRISPRLRDNSYPHPRYAGGGQGRGPQSNRVGRTMQARWLLALILLIIPQSVASAAPRQPIIFWHEWTSNASQAVNAICQRFNEFQDQYEVKPLLVSGGPSFANTKMLLGIVGGNPPDCMAQWSPVIASWGRRGMLLPLDAMMEPGEFDRLKTWLYPAVLRASMYQGHLYSLPTNFNAFALFYNARHFREAGLDPDRPPRTIAELDEDARKLYRLDSAGRIERMGFFPGQLMNWAAAFGGRWYNPQAGRITATDPHILDALTWMQSYALRYDMNRIAAFQAGQTNLSDATWPFLDDKTVSMVEDGQWRVHIIHDNAPPGFDYRVCPLPSPDGKRIASFCAVNLMIIPRGAKNPRGAWEFIKFWNGWKDHDDGSHVARAAEFYTWGGWLPTSPKIAEQPAYKAYLKQYPQFQTFVNIAASPDAQVAPQFPIQQYFLDRVDEEAEAVMRSVLTPAQGLHKLQVETQAELDRVNAH